MKTTTNRHGTHVVRCMICGEPGQMRCAECLRVLAIVEASDPASLVLVADGSFGWDGKDGSSAGAGLVLARECDEAVVAYRACYFHAKNANDAEEEAALRAIRWAPIGLVWTDSKYAVRKLRGRASWLPHELRDPLHNLAHRLSTAGRFRDWDRIERMWIPGEVWP